MENKKKEVKLKRVENVRKLREKGKVRESWLLVGLVEEQKEICLEVKSLKGMGVVKIFDANHCWILLFHSFYCPNSFFYHHYLLPHTSSL